MFKGLARFIVYSLLCIPLIIVAVLILRQVQYSFNLRSSLLRTESQGSYFSVQQAMAANELSTKTFFLIFVCFLMILCGLFLILRGTDNAFNFSKQTKVRYSLKTAYPGVVMAIFGSTLLAYSIYQSQRQQVNITQQLQLLLAKGIVQRGDKKEVAYEKDIDTSRISPETGIAITKAIPEPATPAEKTDTVAITDPVSAVAATPSVVSIMPEEITWANQLASRSVAFGYDPTGQDFKAYNDIVERARKSTGAGERLNSDLQWAFKLLQKTKNGYQPSDGEMSRYESVVTDQLREKGKVTIN